MKPQLCFFLKKPSLVTEVSLISAEALFCLRALLLVATRIHSYTRMASLIRTWLSDSYTIRSKHFQRGHLWVQLYPRMKTFLLVPRRPSNHRPTTSQGFNIQPSYLAIPLSYLAILLTLSYLAIP